jgi:hypothetical protein
VKYHGSTDAVNDIFGPKKIGKAIPINCGLDRQYL